MSATITVDYPSKAKLSRGEAMDVLSVGPLLEWFFPWAVLGEVRTLRPNQMPYGLVHRYDDAEGNPKLDVRTFYSQEDARWALEHLYRSHRDGCRCMVFFWTPATVNYGQEFVR